VVFQKKVCLGSPFDPGEGGPAESHREYYVGEGFLWSPPRQFTVSPQERRGLPTCLDPTGSRLCSLGQRVEYCWI